MRQKTQRIDLSELGYEDESGTPFWVEVPLSVSEGYVYETTSMSRQNADDVDPNRRVANARILDLVSAWNLTDDEGQPVPLTRNVKLTSFKDVKGGATALDQWHEARTAIVAQTPLPAFARIMTSVLRVGLPNLPEGVAGNSTN